MNEIEEWKDIEGYEGFYQISSFGRVKSLERINIHSNGHRHIVKEKILKQHKNNKDYYMVSLSLSGTQKWKTVHRLVAEAFIPNPDNKPEVDHINGNRQDNRVENLRFCTHKENLNNPNAIKKFTERTYSDETLKKMSDAKKGKHISPNTEFPSKPVCQYSLNGEFITEWTTASEAGRNGYNQSHISACCRGVKKAHKGYLWRFKS